MGLFGKERKNTFRLVAAISQHTGHLNGEESFLYIMGGQKDVWIIYRKRPFPLTCEYVGGGAGRSRGGEGGGTLQRKC